ncbi:hypothetical protein LZC95_08325 [Pendulispora brunnea]|uniref:F5/8 type C domain-containing protein n=1 Tax=Pendulispora brunnea TaxID=2905690 RepID=A0ABZ2KDR0_9BACT
MAKFEGITAVAPQFFYYVLIDGTDAVDSAAFGAELEKHTGWRNLYGDFLARAKKDPQRLHDPAHPFLPICLVEAGGKKVAVVCPGGRNAYGKDPFWITYPGRDPKTGEPDPDGIRDWSDAVQTKGRHTAAEESARYTQDLFLRPQVELEFGGAGGTQVIPQLPGGPASSNAVHYSADLLYFSSHGWLGGFARGNSIVSWQLASPPEARAAYTPSVYFSVGRYAAEGRGFAGPKWIVLAQCSTINAATWVLWARVFAKSHPHVRGILAYEEASPGADSSVSIAQRFFQHLKDKKPFLDAWRAANQTQKWAAIVHKEALGDRLDLWSQFKPLTTVETTADTFSYYGFLSSHSGRQEIRDKPPPFRLKLESSPDGQTFHEVSSANLDDRLVARYQLGWVYRVTLTVPKGHIVRGTMRWVHIRPTYPEQPLLEELFASVSSRAQHAVIGMNRAAQTLDIAANGSPSEIVFELYAAPDQVPSHLHDSHSYLWPSVSLETSAGKANYDFTITGLGYYGIWSPRR